VKAVMVKRRQKRRYVFERTDYTLGPAVIKSGTTTHARYLAFPMISDDPIPGVDLSVALI